MTISPYFRNLRTAYFAEIDDLMCDSEGKHVLAQRLAQRRKEINFLIHMLQISPEMVAVVFHKAFKFNSPAVMDNVLSYEPEDLPEWDSVADTIEIAPNARELVQTIRKQAMGDWFLTVAAALEYMYNMPDTRGSARGQAQDDADEDDEDGTDNVRDLDDLDEEEKEARAAEEAGADWMVEQGFDRKD